MLVLWLVSNLLWLQPVTTRENTQWSWIGRNYFVGCQLQSLATDSTSIRLAMWTAVRLPTWQSQPTLVWLIRTSLHHIRTSSQFLSILKISKSFKDILIMKIDQVNWPWYRAMGALPMVIDGISNYETCVRPRRLGRSWRMFTPCSFAAHHLHSPLDLRTFYFSPYPHARDILCMHPQHHPRHLRRFYLSYYSDARV